MSLLPIKSNYKQWRRAILAAKKNRRAVELEPSRETAKGTRLREANQIRARRQYFRECR